MSPQTQASLDELAELQLGLPHLVWRHCRDGAARATILRFDHWDRRILDVTKARHLVPAGLYRLAVDGPWYRAERQIDLRSQARLRLRLAEHSFIALPVDTVAVAREQASPASSGTIWIRVMRAHGQSFHEAQVDLRHRASLRITVPGRTASAMVVAVSPQQGARHFVLPMDYSSRERRSVGWLVLRRHGSALFVAGRLPAGRASQVAAALEMGDTETAGRAAAGILRSSRGRDLPVGAESALLATALVASGRFDDLAPWIGRSLSDPVASSDLHAAMAEWYSQYGCHLAALNLLVRMTEIGRPVLTRSYRVAMALLSAYAESGPVMDHVYASARETGFSRELFRLVGERDPRSIPHVRGQELESWNKQQAGTAADHLSRGVSAVDWDQLFLTYRGSAAGGLRLRTQPGWRRFDWRLDSTGLRAVKPGHSNKSPNRRGKEMP